MRTYHIKKKQLAIYVTEELNKKLDTKAKKLDVSKTKLINLILIDGLTTTKRISIK